MLGFRPALLVIGVTVASGCTSPKGRETSDGYAGTPLETDPPIETIRLATFNIEWLTADPLEGNMRRNDVDHAMVTDLIEHISPDVLVLQEIEGEDGLAHLELPDHYAWAISTSGWSQNIALVWRQDRVSMTGLDELNLPSTSGASKEPMTGKVTIGALTFLVVGIHHAASDDNASSRERAVQARELVEWVDDTLPDVHAGVASDNVVVMGDFNDTFEGINPTIPSLDPFFSAGFVFASEAAETYSLPSYRSLIDHIALSPSLAEHWSADGESGGCTVETHDITPPWSDYTDGFRDRQNISDHRPVWIDLTVPR